MNYLPMLAIKPLYIIIAAIVVVLAIVGVVLFIVYGKGKRLARQFRDLENRINEIKALPIKEKLAKLEVIGKNNVVFASVYEEDSTLEEDAKAYYEIEIIPEVDKIRVELNNKKYDQIQDYLDVLKDKINVYEEKERNILDNLNHILKDDDETRSYEDVVRNKFKEYKDLYARVHDDVSFYEEQLKDKENEIDSSFEGYDDDLRRGNFLDAKDTLKEIERKIDFLTSYLKENASLIKTVTIELPNRLNEVINLYNDMNGDYLLYHIEVSKTVGILTEEINNLMNMLEVFESKNVYERASECLNSIETIRSKLENERESKIQYDELHDALLEKEKSIEEEWTKKMREYTHIGKSLKIDESVHKLLVKTKTDVNKLTGIRKKLEGLEYGHNIQPYSSRVNTLKDMSGQMDVVEKSVKEFEDVVHALKSDAENAYQLINDCSNKLKNAEFKLKNTKHDVLIASYVKEFNYSYELVSKLAELSTQSPLDIEKMKETAKELSIASEKLLHNVKLDMEKQKYASDLIVFANRYRSGFTGIAHSISRAEELYFSGKFNEAIDVALTATGQFDLPEKLKHKVGD